MHGVAEREISLNVPLAVAARATWQRTDKRRFSLNRGNICDAFHSDRTE